MDDLRRAARWYVASVVLLWVSIIVLGAFGYVTNSHRASEGQRAHTFLCAQLENIKDRINSGEDRLAASQEFIAHGGHIPGVTRAQLLASQTIIQRDLKNDKKTFKTGRQILNCN